MKVRCRIGLHNWGRWYHVPVLWTYAGRPVARGLGTERRCRDCCREQSGE